MPSAVQVEALAIDGAQLRQFDYVDIGRIIEVTNVVPIIVKSLLFNYGLTKPCTHK